MNRTVLVAAVLASLVSGCASVREPLVVDEGLDYQKVATINSVARARGVEVHWVNYPQRRPTPANVVPSLGEPAGT